jgi:hypothetical protein
MRNPKRPVRRWEGTTESSPARVFIVYATSKKRALVMLAPYGVMTVASIPLVDAVSRLLVDRAPSRETRA